MKPLTSLFALCALAPLAAQASGPAPERPNILLICADDLGFSDIGCYGSEVRTPNIDALAASGVRFRQFHNTSKSYPSRSCLLTGLYAQQNGYFRYFDGPLENSITLGEYLKSAGYTTLWAGKHHGVENPRTRGFDHYFGLMDGSCNYFNPGVQREFDERPAQKKHNRGWAIEERNYAPYTPPQRDFYTTDYFTNYALQWLEETENDDNPFFLYLAYTAPHDPLMAWPEDIAKYDGDYAEGYEAIRRRRFEKQRAMGLVDDRYLLSEPTYTLWEELTEQERIDEQRKMAVYAAMIDRMDQNIGRVLDLLRVQGKYDNTLILFVSDNGASAEVVELEDSYGPIGSISNWMSLGENWANVGNTPLRYYKNFSYEGGIATPLIASWPGVTKGGTFSDFPGHLIDFMATFVDLVGVPYPAEFDGRRVLPFEGESLLGAIRGQEPVRTRPIFWEWQDGSAAREGRWKIVRKDGSKNPWALFDIAADPAETRDLAAAHPAEVARLAQLWDDWKARVQSRDDMKAISKTICLNGRWEVAMGDRQPAAYPATIPVPGVLTMATPQFAPAIELDGNDLLDDVGYDYIWYRRHFTLDDPLCQRAFLNIRAKYNVRVYLNGQEIGYDHHSTYSHARFEVSEALNRVGENELVVRVGSWNTASAPSRENSAEWWRNSRAPGIWDDVTLELGSDVDIVHIKLLPDLKAGVTHIEAIVNRAADLKAGVEILDAEQVVSGAELTLADGTAAGAIPSQMLTPWTPGKTGNPKLYRARMRITDADGRVVAERSQPFGYRSIETRGRDVLLNGEKIMFRADNIAFVRALTRWNAGAFDEQWIRAFLRAAIHDYGFNYLRIHLGHAYNKWYEIADQEGILLHDEWRYMHDDEPMGRALAEAQIELRRWVEQNVNHPSIVVWDQENEGNVRLENLKKELRTYDPTRLWGEDDYYAKHVYDYSERAIPAPFFAASADKPSTVLESCRLWLNEPGLLEPREDFKTSRTASGWGVWYFDRATIGQLHADLHADIGTYFRSIRVQAWSPFALLSGWVNGQNYFYGNLADSLTPQPNLLVLKALNRPVGASIDMLQATEWYLDKTTYTPGKKYRKPVLVWNDTKDAYRGTLRLEVGGVVTQKSVTIPAWGVQRVEMRFTAPTQKGVWMLRPSLDATEGVARRILVAGSGEQIPAEALAFGGSRTPIEGGEGVIRNFLHSDYNAPEAVERAIIAAVDGGLLDKLSFEDGRYRLQSTRFTPTTAITTTTRLDASGNTLSTERCETLAYLTLPAPVKEAIIRALGTVPVDESRITRKTNPGGGIYEISVIGNENRFRLDIADDGQLRKTETITPQE